VPLALFIGKQIALCVLRIVEAADADAKQADANPTQSPEDEQTRFKLES